MIKKKSLGQHFLNSEKIISDIVLAGKVKKGDMVIEIGPGEGILTSALLKTGAHVITVEKDQRLIPILSNKFTEEIASKQLHLFHADILDSEMSKTVFDTKKSYKVVANIPYYITGQIIRMFLEADKQPSSMTLLVQKEVAERIVAKDGKESLLSLSVKVYGQPKLIRTVGRGAFTPQPNVDSVVLHIENISRTNFTKDSPSCSERGFFKILHAGFAHKRKQLFPNLVNSSLEFSLGNGVSKLEEVDKKEILTKAFLVCNINPKSRAEDLSIETWIKLCNIISK